MRSKGKVLVTDGRSLAALAIARSLGRKGIEVHCGEEFPFNITSFSKYIKKTWIYPSPELHPDWFLKELKRITIAENFDMIIPVRDAATLLVARYADDLSKITNIYVADYNLVETLQDKGKTIRLARECGVPHPETFFPEEVDLGDIIASIETPFLIRARTSSGSRGIAYVRNHDEFRQRYESVRNTFGEPIIQAYIRKQSYCTACVLLDQNSEEVASFTYERVKEYPLSGGPTVVGISCDNPQVKAYALRLLQDFEWKGVAEVEFIIDEKGEPKLLEVNPRYWMPLHLAIYSKVDFPYLHYKLATGQKVSKIIDYEIGVKYRWLFPNELLWFLESPNKIRNLKDFTNFFTGNECDGVLSASDPGPFFGSICQSMSFLKSKEKRDFIFNRGWKP